MDLNIESQQAHIRKIEDIIDIQKANGNIRQVAFNIPSDNDSSLSAGFAKSLETGLSRVDVEHNKKKSKKIRYKKRKHDMPDVISWPSDSDVTVLRMKLCSEKDTKDKKGDIVLGDGLHHRNSFSMVNLATLVFKSQPPSKQSLNEEFLLPLTSWEHHVDPKSEEQKFRAPNFLETNEFKIYDCFSRKDNFSKLNNCNSESSMKSKVARFLRLYFCPCCSCLYNIENYKKSSQYTSPDILKIRNK